MEIVVLLGGTDETLADRIYARHSYVPDDIHWDHQFVDILTLHPQRQAHRGPWPHPRHDAAGPEIRGA